MNTVKAWRKNYLVFGSPSIGEAELNEVVACLKSKWLGSGPRVKNLEDQFKTYLGVKEAVALSSCTAALHLALRELKLKAGDEVLVPAMTFCATANAVVNAGLKPVFVDCEQDTMNMDPQDVRRKITPKTKAMLPVHFAGRPCDMPTLMAIAKENNLYVIEDCAHAIESTIDGKHCGTFGDYGAFSFYVTKNVTTVEGGLIVCQKENFADRIRTAALHGMSKDAWERYSDKGYKHYEVIEPGFKYNMTDLQASLGLKQVEKISKMHRRRQEIWDYYQSELKNLPLRLPSPVKENTTHSYHLFTCLVDDKKISKSRDTVLDELDQLKIGTGVHYTALPHHKYYRETTGAKVGDFPNAEYIGERTFSIPLSAGLTDKDVMDVVKALKQVCEA